MCEVCERCSIEMFVEEIVLKCVFENLTLNVYCFIYIYMKCVLFMEELSLDVHVLDSVSSTWSHYTVISLHKLQKPLITIFKK